MVDRPAEPRSEQPAPQEQHLGPDTEPWRPLHLVPDSGNVGLGLPARDVCKAVLLALPGTPNLVPHLPNPGVLLARLEYAFPLGEEVAGLDSGL